VRENRLNVALLPVKGIILGHSTIFLFLYMNDEFSDIKPNIAI
jgi:hypothetical protein